MRTIIAGSRNVRDYSVFYSALLACPWMSDITEVVEGGARGIDSWARFWASEVGLPVKTFPADWDAHGRAAGPIRNRQMAEYADALVAMPMGESRGTRNMIAEAKKRGLRVWVYELEPDREQ